MVKTICFANLKGGTGKSNVLFNIAGTLAEEYKNILIIDLDPQGNITNNMGINKRHFDVNTSKEIFESNTDIKDLIVTSDYKHISIIPANLSLFATEYKIISKAGRELYLKRFLEKHRDFLERYFHYILIDTNPSFNVVNQNAFIVSDSIVLVNDTSFNSVDGAEYFVELWTEIREHLQLKDNIKAFIINKFDKRTRLDREFLEYVRNHEIFKDILIETVIPYSVKFRETEIESKPIFSNLVEKTYKQLVKELKEKGVL